jgi:hypothetical protein
MILFQYAGSQQRTGYRVFAAFFRFGLAAFFFFLSFISSRGLGGWRSNWAITRLVASSFSSSEVANGFLQ